jgi:hypothetical protein
LVQILLHISEELSSNKVALDQSNQLPVKSIICKDKFEKLVISGGKFSNKLYDKFNPTLPYKLMFEIVEGIFTN